MNKKKIRLGIFFPSSKLWMGGANYYFRLISLLSERSSDVEIIVFMSRDIDGDFVELLSSMKNVELVSVDSTKQSFKDILLALILGKDKVIDCLSCKYGIDVFYSNATFFGWNFKIPVLSWVPDLQHLYLPEMFSFMKKLKRNMGFLLQANFSSGVVFSSYDAKKSFQNKYSVSNDKLFVARFSVKPSHVSLQDIKKVKDKYQLSDDYIFLPNQYWPHKNHETVLRAIDLLKRSEQSAYQIVSTGSKESETFQKCLNLIDELAISSSEYKILGLIPLCDVLTLMAGSSFVLNPSLFEGWSTTVEEAKSLNKKMILSDIPIHREQDLDYFQFFEPHNIKSLAKLISTSNNKKLNINTEPEVDFQMRFFEELDFAIKSVTTKRNI